MARIAGVNIPTGKRVEIALTYIHGIGRTKAKAICDRAAIPSERRVNQLTDDEVVRVPLILYPPGGRTHQQAVVATRVSNIDLFPTLAEMAGIELPAPVAGENLLPLLEGKGIFEMLDFLVSNLLLPINGLLIAIFAGWIMSREAIWQELGLQNKSMFIYIRCILRFVAPIVIGMIFYTSLT